MKKLILLTILPLLLFLFNRCEPDEPTVNDPTAPSISVITNTVSTAPGYEFWMEADISDDVQIKKINLLKADWHLDKDIVLTDSVQKDYRLSYKFKTPDDAVEGDHKVKITVEDIGGNIVTDEVLVLLNRDITPPEFVISTPTEGQAISGGERISLFIEVKDNTGVDTFIVNGPNLGIDTLIAFNPVNPRYVFVKDYRLPDELADGTYYINLIATDSTSNIAQHAISLNVGAVKSDNVYLVGGASWTVWELPNTVDDGNANPMQMSPDADEPGWFEIMTYSYGLPDQNGVKFVGQRAWTPNNWGLETEDQTSAIINSDESKKILLEDEGYYKVRFNPGELDYSIEKDEEVTPERSEMYMLGSGIAGMEDAWLDPSGALAMTQDTENPYIYTATVEFSATGSDDWGATFIFIGNKNNASEFSLGFNFIPSDAIDPAWTDYQGYVVGDLSLNVDPLTDDQWSGLTEWPPSGNWNGVPYIAYYEQAGSYLIKLDYKSMHASITKIAE